MRVYVVNSKADAYDEPIAVCLTRDEANEIRDRLNRSEDLFFVVEMQLV
jgi:hypothetical protein